MFSSIYIFKKTNSYPIQSPLEGLSAAKIMNRLDVQESLISIYKIKGLFQAFTMLFFSLDSEIYNPLVKYLTIICVGYRLEANFFQIPTDLYHAIVDAGPINRGAKSKTYCISPEYYYNTYSTDFKEKHKKLGLDPKGRLLYLGRSRNNDVWFAMASFMFFWRTPKNQYLRDT